MFKTMKSPNYGHREGVDRPSLIILHYTGMQTARAALERLCDPAAQVSAHYFIDEDGKVKQLVEDQFRAWHAGKSCWRGQADINAHSLGIELVNPGHEFGYCEFPPVQIQALDELCQRLMKKYKISPGNVLAHSDVAPSRKTDPGEFFPWAALAAEGIGIWPHPNDIDRQAATDLAADHIHIHQLLIEFGYDPEASFEQLVTAFHRHFYPEKFRKGSNPAIPDNDSIARLLSLIRARHDAESLKKRAL